MTETETTSAKASSGFFSTKSIIAIATAVVVVGGVAVGVMAYAKLKTSDDYPYNHMASNASLYVQTNIDPSADQKLAFNKLAKKFNDIDDAELQKFLKSDNINAELVKEIADSDKGFDWVGDRVAVAAYPKKDNPKDMTTAIMIQTNDTEKAKKDVNRIVKRMNDDTKFENSNPSAGKPAKEPSTYTAKTYDDKWVAITDGKIKNIFESDKTLADDDKFIDDFDAIQGNVFSMWANVKDTGDLSVAGIEKSDKLEGIVTASMKVHSDGLDFAVKSHGLKNNGKALVALSPGGNAKETSKLLEENSFKNSILDIGFTNLGETLKSAVKESDSKSSSDTSTDNTFDEFGLSTNDKTESNSVQSSTSMDNDSDAEKQLKALEEMQKKYAKEKGDNSSKPSLKSEITINGKKVTSDSDEPTLPGMDGNDMPNMSPEDMKELKKMQEKFGEMNKDGSAPNLDDLPSIPGAPYPDPEELPAPQSPSDQLGDLADSIKPEMLPGLFGENTAISIKGDDIENLKVAITFNKTDKGVWEKFLNSQKPLTHPNDPEKSFNSMLGDNSTFELNEDNVKIVVGGEKPNGGKKIDSGYIIGSLDLDNAGKLIDSASKVLMPTFGPQQEAPEPKDIPKDLGTVNFSVNSNKAGDSTVVVKWRTPRK